MNPNNLQSEALDNPSTPKTEKATKQPVSGKIKPEIYPYDTNLETEPQPDPEPIASGKPTTAGDPDAMNEQAKIVGEEAIGGTTPTPDQSSIDDLSTAVGVDVPPEEPVQVTNELYERDKHRFELDPDSKDANLADSRQQATGNRQE